MSGGSSGFEDALDGIAFFPVVPWLIDPSPLSLVLHEPGEIYFTRTRRVASAFDDPFWPFEVFPRPRLISSRVSFPFALIHMAISLPLPDVLVA